MADSLGFAVVGVGWFGSKRISALNKIKDASIRWIVDLDKERGQEAAREANSNYTSDIHRALSDPNVDCVLVCTPNILHPEVVVEALKNDKHVLCEKPLARNVKEAQLMVDAANHSAGFLKTGSNHRYFPNVAKAFELVKSKRIGEPIFFRGSIGHNGDLLKGRWFWDANAAGGGTFLDNGSHLLDICRELMGDFNHCMGMVSTTFWPVAPLEDNGFSLYRSAAGKTALVQSSWVEWYGYMYFEIYGSEGFVIVDSRRANKTLFGLRGEESTTLYDYSDVPPRSHELEISDFMRHVRKNEQPRPSGQDGLRVLQMVQALYDSSRDGKEIVF
ncbi:MAG: Gfo/Idh/MocA family oxidoreductase [Thaumarchaeota archaeon]|nr:Gfo/Idh/MocA family oxidoreductase [Nitrososphaerota archaeon]